jgi:aspartyl/asparaginyl beta-hydroxylase (cupin superfamily)
MTDYVAEANKATEQYLSALAKTQEEFVKAFETFMKQMPALPASAVPAPVADLPTASEVTTVTFDFAEKVLAQHRATTDKLIELLAAKS